MRTFWKKTGWFSLAVVALVSSLLLQVIMGFIAVMPGMFFQQFVLSMSGVSNPEVLAEATMNSDLMIKLSTAGVMGYHILSIPVYGLWFYYGCVRKKFGNPFKIMGGRGIAGVAVMGFGLSALAEGIALLLSFLVPNSFEAYADLMNQIGNSGLVIFSAIILAPIGEELLCRGIILHYMQKVTSGMKNKELAFWIANALQALCFGIMHANIIQGTYAFMLGLGLGWLVRRFDSLYPSMLAHLVVNVLGTSIMALILAPIPESILGAVIAMAIGAAVCAAAFFILRRRGVQTTENA